MFWLTLVVVITVVLAIGFFIAELCLFQRPALQDVVWRSCLVALFLFPTGILLRPWLPRLEISLPLSVGSLTSGTQENITTFSGQLENQAVAKVATQSQEQSANESLNTSFSETNAIDTPTRNTQKPPQNPELTRDSSSELLATSIPTAVEEPATPRSSYFAGASYFANTGPALSLMWLAVAILKLLQVASHWYRSRRILRTSTTDANSKWNAVTKELSPKSIQVAFSPCILSPMVGPCVKRKTTS